MTCTYTRNNLRSLRRPGWDPVRGVFILQEGAGQRALKPGVALQGPNGRRIPERKPIVICDPARLSRRRSRSGQPGALKVAAWIVVGVGLGCLALLAAVACVGSF